MELRKAITEKLRSNLKLSEKCNLAKNTFLSNSVRVAQKEEMILSWIATTLLKKFSANLDDNKDGELWTLLLSLSKSPKFEQSFLAACHDNFWDFFNTAVDHFNLCQDRALMEQCLSSLIRNFRHIRSVLLKQHEQLNVFIGKCLDNDAIVSDVLWLYGQAIQHQPSAMGANFFEVLLPKLLTLDGYKCEVQRLVSHGLFAKELVGIWSAFLKSIINQPSVESKPKSGEILEKLFMKLSSMSHDHQLTALGAIFASCLKSRCVVDQCKALLFITGCDILQFFPTSEEVTKLSPLASTVVLPKFKMSVKERLECLQNMSSSLVEFKMDLTTQLVDSDDASTLLKFIQHLLKHLLTNCKDDLDTVSKIAVALAHYTPMVIEPLVGSLAVAIMSIKDDSVRTDLMSQTISLFHKLRQLPKLVARVLIYVSKMDKGLEWNSAIVSCFAEKIVLLPSGQLLELWKTFEYHMTVNCIHAHSTIEALMPVFLLNACLVDQSVPDPTMTKVLAIIKSCQEMAHNFPKVARALDEVCVMLKATRGLDLPYMGLTNLQKRKLESIDEEVLSKKAKQTQLTWSDIKDDPATWKAVLPELEESELWKALEEILINSSALQDKAIFEESPTLQAALVNIILDQLMKQNKKAKVLASLRKNDISSAASLVLKKTDITLTAENDPFDLLQCLPLEHMEGHLEIVVSLLLLALIKSHAKFALLLARTCQGVYRPSSLLKHVSVTEVLDALSEVPGDVGHILHNLTKIGVMYQKPLDEIIEKQATFVSPLETLTNEAKVHVSVTLMESLHPLLTLKSINEDKKAKCASLFKALSKAFLKGLKKEDNILDPLLIIRALTPVIEVSAKEGVESGKKALKKCNLSKYIPYCLASLREESVCVKFLSTLLANFSTLAEKKMPDLGSFLGDFANSKFCIEPIEKEDGLAVLQLLFETSSENDIEVFQKLLNSLVEATVRNFPNLDIYSNWKVLVLAKLQGDALGLRREAIEKILPLMTLVSVTEANLKHYYLPTLELQASLLAAEKPILYKESEAFCVSTCVALKLDQELLQTHPQLFEQLWMSVYKVISTAFHKRPSSLVISRIPLMITAIRNLLRGLAAASDQKRGLEAGEIKAVTQLAHNFDRLCDHIKKLKEEFARVAPYLISDVMESMQKVTMYPSARSNVMFGVHKLLDICDSHSSDFLSAVMPPGQQEMFKHVYTNYKSYHKYSGKV